MSYQTPLLAPEVSRGIMTWLRLAMDRFSILAELYIPVAYYADYTLLSESSMALPEFGLQVFHLRRPCLRCCKQPVMLLALVTSMGSLVYRHKKNPREATQAYA